MLSLPLGPLALPLPPVLALAALLLAVGVTRWRMPAADAAGRSRAESAVWLGALIGFAAARAGHLLAHAEAYAGTPLAMLDIRDGGWNAAFGLLAGFGWLAWQGRHWPAGRRALGTGALAGLVGWAGLQAVVAAASSVRDVGVPAVSLVSLDDGRTRPLAEVLAGRPAVVNLWATWCGPCRAEMPVLAAAQRQERDVLFVFANQGERPEVVRAWLAREGLALADVWLDPRSALGPAVGSRGLPTTLFYDGTGRRVDAHLGVLNAAALQAKLAALRRAGAP